MKFNWAEKMSIGNSVLDEQHKQLMEQINKLNKQLAGDVDMGAMREALHFLNEYATKHVDYEEKYLKKIGYPYMKEHKQMHDSFMQFIDELNEKFKKLYLSQGFSSADIHTLLTDVRNHLEVLGKWWMKHIVKHGRNLAVYSARKAIRQHKI